MVQMEQKIIEISNIYWPEINPNSTSNYEKNNINIWAIVINARTITSGKPNSILYG